MGSSLTVSSCRLGPHCYCYWELVPPRALLLPWVLLPPWEYLNREIPMPWAYCYNATASRSFCRLGLGYRFVLYCN